MKPEAQQIAIAKACGWTEIEPQRLTSGGGDYFTGKFHGLRKDGSRDYFVPDYPKDLNAMHNAEKVLIRPNLYAKGGWGMYLGYLSRVTDEQHPIDATAAQRAEAFLRTIGKWEGE